MTSPDHACGVDHKPAATEGGDPATEGGDPATEGGGPATEGGGPATEGGGPATEGGGPAPQKGGPSECLHAAPAGVIGQVRCSPDQEISDPDGVILSLAVRQHGVISRRQLLEAGFSAHTIDYRVMTGRLLSLHRGVYRVGPFEGRYQREMAAVLACGQTAVLSHSSAAAVWGLLPPKGDRAPIEVSNRQGSGIAGHSVRVHRVRRMDIDETTLVDGIPITVPVRTLLDLAGSVRERELEQALAAANRKGLIEDGLLAQQLARYPRRRGTRRLRGLLERDIEPAFTRSEAESRFLGLLRKARIREPEVNARLKGYEVDFFWRRERLVVEVDGFAFHSSSGAFERDRRRDGVLASAGFRVFRVTWRQLTEEPEVLLVLLAQALFGAVKD